LANHHHIINHTSSTNSEKNIIIQCFAGLLAFQLLQNV
jgi:hypothetical protein